MLRLIVAATLCAGAGVANAGSIEPFAATASERKSIVEFGCPSCARAAAKKAAEEAEIKLKPGEQIVEAREVDGQMMIYRTENWLGGSPVTMVRKATEADLVALGVARPDSSQTAAADSSEASKPVRKVTIETVGAPAILEPVTANTSPGIDEDTKTSALGEKPVEPFDPSTFDLRLN